MGNNENELQYEQNRVDYTVKEIKKREAILDVSIDHVREEAKEIRTNFWNDVTVNLSSSDDVIETEISIRQQEQLLREREQNYKHVEKQLSSFQQLKESPYFARIDLKEKEGEIESIYIGTSSFIDDEDHFLVYDWRAPISSVYYDGSLGEVAYQTPVGEQLVEVSLKRQFLIKKAQIQTMFDSSETIGDEMLQDILGDQSNAQMKSIVSTIQKEQNKIIRDTKSHLLFVQGAAGSGKTSAILQRIAYLLYQFRNEVDSNQMMIFSPNKLFNHYISNVLPELGEANIQQTTFLDFASSRIKNMEIKDLFEQFENEKNQKRKNIIAFKEEPIFFKALERYAQLLETQGMIFKDIVFRNKVLMSKEKIKALFYSFPEHYTLPQRLLYTTQKLNDRLDEIAKVEAKRSWVEAQIQLLNEEEYQRMIPTHQKFKNYQEEVLFIGTKIVNRQLKKVRRMIAQFNFFHYKAQYANFLKVLPKLVSLEKYSITHEQWITEQKRAISDLNQRVLLMEDVVPYLYLSDAIIGKEPLKKIKYIFIDEIQDYSVLQIAYLKSLFPNGRFTMLGDLNQAIFKNKLAKNTLLEEIKPMFDETKIKAIQLTKTYRSTKEITNFTKGILMDDSLIEPFERLGELPELVVTQSNRSWLNNILKQAKKYETDSQLTAIIGKTKKECDYLYHQLKEVLSVNLISFENQQLAEGIMIIPSYLAKGLEFDTVIVANASNKNYSLEEERTLMYTICSRAMHRLIVNSFGDASFLFDNVSPELYLKK
ncbi:RNA polymerase recycling motor HelD [Carnobacterium divergens]|uniref:RNA polymerase recycling motor HelD n=1 Tax=Carnobacterium divergens TaxID=2748 RepID=UPI0039AF2D25